MVTHLCIFAKTANLRGREVVRSREVHYLHTGRECHVTQMEWDVHAQYSPIWAGGSSALVGTAVTVEVAKRAKMMTVLNILVFCAGLAWEQRGELFVKVDEILGIFLPFEFILKRGTSDIFYEYTCQVFTYCLQQRATSPAFQNMC